MDEFLKRPKYFLSLCGVWPLKSIRWPRSYYTYGIINLILLYIFVASLLISFFLNINDLEVLSESAVILGTTFTYALKLTCFAINRNKFIKLLKLIKNPIYVSYEEDQEKYMTEWAKCTNMYTKLSLCIAFTSGCGFVIRAWFFSDEYHPIPYNAWFPVDVKDNTLNWALANIFHVSQMVYLVWIDIHLDVAPCVFMNICCAQIQILKDSLENVIIRAEKYYKLEEKQCNKGKKNWQNYFEMLDENVDKKVQEMLGFCVERHIAIINLLNYNIEVFSVGMFLHFISVGFTICFTGFRIASTPMGSVDFLINAIYFAAVVFDVGLYCWNGQHVLSESSTIVNSCFVTEWYRCSTKVRKILFILMERAKHPLQFSAGGLFICSHDTLKWLMKSSYSYFAVLKNITDQKE